MATVRLDIELVRRGLARSRRHAGELISTGRVFIDGDCAPRSATPLSDGQHVTVAGSDDPDYASRAGHKLAGALVAWGSAGPRVQGRECLDAGASTGGFTDVLLRCGAAHVVAVDVGHGQLIERLRSDPRVDARDGVNVRHLEARMFEPLPELVVADLSFISLTLVLPALTAVVAGGGDLVVMVKPQFEVGRERLGSGGVVRDPALRVEAVVGVAESASTLGWATAGAAPSVLPGPSGNREYFLWLRQSAVDPLDQDRLRAQVEDVVLHEPVGIGS